MRSFKEFLEKWSATNCWFARSGLIHYLEQSRDLGFAPDRANFRVQAAREILKAANGPNKSEEIAFPNKLLKTLVEGALRDISTWRQKQHSNNAFNTMGTLLVNPELLERVEMHHLPLFKLVQEFLVQSPFNRPSWWIEAVIATECFDLLETRHASEAVPLMWQYLMKEVGTALCKEKYDSEGVGALRKAPIRISSLVPCWGSYAHRYNQYGRAVSVRAQALVLFLAQCGLLDSVITPPDHEVKQLQEVLRANPLKILYFH